MSDDVIRVLLGLWEAIQPKCSNVGEWPRPDCSCDVCKGFRALDNLERNLRMREAAAKATAVLSNATSTRIPCRPPSDELTIPSV